MSRTHSMTSGSPLRLLLLFALPLMAGNVFQQLYTVVDTAIVGRGVGMDALAALGTVDWLTWTLLGICQGFAQGFSVRMAQKFGEGDLPGLRRVFARAMGLCAIIAVVCVAVSEACLPLFLRVLRVPDELYRDAQLYAVIIFAGLPAVMYYNFTASALRAVGDARSPLYAMIAASLVNIALDSLTVFVLGWGIAGAAAATVFSQLLSGVICTLRLIRIPELHITRTDFARVPGLDLTLMKLGLPVAMMNLIIAVGGVTVQSIVNGFEIAFIAGFTATNKLYGLLEIAAISYGYAVTTYVGQNVGAGDYARVRRGTRTAVLLSIVTSLVIGGCMIAFGRGITSLFISADTPELAAAAGDVAYRFLCAMSAALPILYVLYAYRSALQGMGNTFIPMVSGIVEMFMRIGVAVAVGRSGYENGIFFAEIFAWSGAAILLCASYYVCLRRIRRRTAL